MRGLSAFYFLEALLCGDKPAFNPEDAGNLIPNLYALGSYPAQTDACSILVGVYSIGLLCRGKEWQAVRQDLGRIGYRESDCLQCETQLYNQEVLRGAARRWQVDVSIVEGYWELLQQPAYTDNMAVHCASKWGMAAEARPTNPLEPETILPRLRASVWFLETIWRAERALRCYTTKDAELRACCGEFKPFSAALMKLNLPLITKPVAVKYLQRAKRLKNWPRPRGALQSDQAAWVDVKTRLEKLVQDCAEANALNPQQKGTAKFGQC